MPHSDYILLAHPYDRSYAMFSMAPPVRRTKAVIFVHGYRGNAVTTWQMFQELIHADKSSTEFWSGCDAYFYQYDSGMPLAAVSQVFRGFLLSLFPVPTASMFSLEPFPEVRGILSQSDQPSEIDMPESYRSLYLVIRQALMELAVDWQRQGLWKGEQREHRESILRSAEVRLFSPALFGYTPTGIQGLLYFLIDQFNVGAAALRSASIHQELKPGSQHLAALRERTQKFAQEYGWMKSMRAHLLYAERDVVHIDRYECDPLYRTQLGHTHTSVCKPNQIYLAPLDFVEHGTQDEHTKTVGSR
jgi:hypothetical protein